MQSTASIGRALYRMVFRGGTPQRIQYSGKLMVTAILVFLVTAIITQRYFFERSFVEVGLALFTVLSGVYLAAALLTRKVVRAKLRASLLSLFLLLAASQIFLLLLLPLKALTSTLPALSSLPLATGLIVLAGLLAGATNVLHFAQGGPRSNAVLLTFSFAAALGAFYSILRSLLEAVFS